MKNALVIPDQPARYISGWNGNLPTFTYIGEFITEVVETTFEVAPPFFWVQCADDVTEDLYYYDPADSTIKRLPDPAPKPA